MQFVLTAYDSEYGRNGGRDAARSAHMENVNGLEQSGMLRLGGPLVEGDEIIGSMMLLEADSRAAVDAYLATEPFNSQGVWEQITVQQCRVLDAYLTKLRA